MRVYAVQKSCGSIIFDDQSDFVRSILRINRVAINRSDFTEGLITQ
jgi:hypothetical protein